MSHFQEVKHSTQTDIFSHIFVSKDNACSQTMVRIHFLEHKKCQLLWDADLSQPICFDSATGGPAGELEY